MKIDTLGDLLRRSASDAPDAEAFRYRDERLTYADWDRLADRMGAALRARGVERGDVVALLLPSTPFYLIAYLAAARLGAVTTGINVRYRRTEISHVLERAAPRLLLGVRRWHDADFHGMVAWPDCVWLDGEELRAGTAPLVDRLAGDMPSAQPVAVDPEDPAAIVFTSGTTGRPKGAWYAHRSILALADIEARRYPAPTGAPPVAPRCGDVVRARRRDGTHRHPDRLACVLAHPRHLRHRDGAGDHRARAPDQHRLLPHAGRDAPRPPRSASVRPRLAALGAAGRRARHRRSSSGACSARLGVVVSVRYSSTEVGIATAVAVR